MSVYYALYYYNYFCKIELMFRNSILLNSLLLQNKFNLLKIKYESLILKYIVQNMNISKLKIKISMLKINNKNDYLQAQIEG